MLFIVRAMVFLLQTALGCAGVDLTIATAPTAPVGGTRLGTTDVAQTGVVVLTISRGTGPAKVTFFTGYWVATGS